MATVYLCGGINGLSDADAKDCREVIKRRFPGPRLAFLDPMRRDYRGREGEPGIAREIVLGDLRDIEASDLILVNAIRPSWGTAMEIVYADKMGKAVAFFGAPAKPSPWLAYHGLNVGDLAGAIAYLEILAGLKP